MTKGINLPGLSWRYLDLNPRGFTLVEMAIVIVILGILVAGGASLIGPLTLRMQTIEAKENLDGTTNAIDGYAAVNNRIPTLAQFPGVALSPNDVWGKPIQYIFDNNLAASICDKTTTNITLRICTNVTCTAFTAVNNVAFIVLSGGGNYNNQTGNSQAVAAPLIIRTYTAGLLVNNEEYDDIVSWVTLPELQSKLSCGRCSAYEIWNNSGASRYFRVNGNGCELVANNAYISSLGPGGGISAFTDAACTAPAAPTSITFVQAAATDANRNCAVNYANPIADR